MAPTAAAAAAAAEQEKESGVPSHAPSVAGSVIEASDGLGGTNYIRIQNMASTGKTYNSDFRVHCGREQDAVRQIPRRAQLKCHGATYIFSLLFLF